MTINWDFADPIDEIYAIRRNISERCGNNIRRIVSVVAKESEGVRRMGRVFISSLDDLAMYAARPQATSAIARRERDMV